MIHTTTAIILGDPTRTRHRSTGRIGLLVFGLLLLAIAGRARAICVGGFLPSSVQFSPSNITLPNSTPVGTVLWTSSPVSPTSPITLSCSGTTNSGVQNSIGGQPIGSDPLFPTNVPGLSYRLLYPDTPHPLKAYPNQPIVSGPIGSVALQLVVTGTIAPGSVLTAGQFAQWNVDACKNSNDGINCNGNGNALVILPILVFNISSPIALAAPACAIAVDPTVVTLPDVNISAFTGISSTASTKPFNVQLSCTKSVNLNITLATGNQQTGTTSVIAPTAGTGYAQNIGVQVLTGSSCTTATPITFGTAIAEGTTSTGTQMNLPFCAQYYQTGTPPTAGNVTATATYTLSYP